MDRISIERRTEPLNPARRMVPARPLVFRTRALVYRGDAGLCPCCDRRLSRFGAVGVTSQAAARAYATDPYHCFPRSDKHVRRSAAGPARGPRGLSVADSCKAREPLDDVGADISSRSAIVRIGITYIQFADDALDVILCSHVLERVGDDGRATRKLRRILGPGGWAIPRVQVDVSRERTFDDPRVTQAAECERLFGQWDHARMYGRDYSRRLADAGFDVQVEACAAQLGPAVAADRAAA
jgi:SAM-dependent methyltransferase